MSTPRKSRRPRWLNVIIIALLISGLAACSSYQVEPDAIGLHYSAGSQDGQAFVKVVRPGEVEWLANDNLHKIATSQRSFIVRKDNQADIDGVINVPAGGTAENSGTLVDFEISLAFKTNTRDNDIPDFNGGTLRRFFEELCRHYGCSLDDAGNDTAGWQKLLREKLFPQLESAFKDEARKYDGDAIVNNVQIPGTKEGTLTLLQTDVGKLFQAYLERQTGAQFFCGPSFDRNNPGDPQATDPRQLPCPPVELLIISADYNDPKIREARSAKKIAVDQSVAQTQLQRALADPNYLEYLRIQALQACGNPGGAICIMDATGRGASPAIPLPGR